MSYTVRSLTTARAISLDVRVYGSGPSPLVFFHGTTGLFDDEPLLEALAARGFTVYAPSLPGYGPEAADSGEGVLDDMLDVTLHGWDIVDALALSRPVTLVGHDVGAMVAAEMAAIEPGSVARLGLVSPLGLWDPATPIADIFMLLPFEFPALLFSDVELGTRLLTGGLDFEDPAAIERFQVRNSRRLGFVGKLLFPVPSRRLATRAYRTNAPTSVVWGGDDKYTPVDAYAALWSSTYAGSASTVIDGTGHCVHVEAPEQVAAAISGA